MNTFVIGVFFCAFYFVFLFFLQRLIHSFIHSALLTNSLHFVASFHFISIHSIPFLFLFFGWPFVLCFPFFSGLLWVFFAEGQKTANTAEWQKQNRINCDTIASLKKDIKELTAKCGRLRNPLQRPIILKENPVAVAGGCNLPATSAATSSSVAMALEKRKTSAALPTIVVGKVNYPIGAKNVEDAIFLTDLKVTENRKQLDLLRHRFKCRKQHFAKLMAQYRELVASKEAQEQNLGEKPPETLEEDNNRKVNQTHTRTYLHAYIRYCTLKIYVAGLLNCVAVVLYL